MSTDTAVLAAGPADVADSPDARALAAPDTGLARLPAAAGPSAAAVPPAVLSAAARAQRSRWLKTLHQWHWISAALALIGMLLFAFTGITLNHAADIEARPEVIQRHGQLPAPLLALLGEPPPVDAAPLPEPVRAWLLTELDLRIPAVAGEWSGDEIYVPLPRPGGDAWLRIGLPDGEVEYELTTRGWIAWLNDLHKGRHTGTAWKWFLDIFAVACLLFCITGLWLLKLHASNRPSTWPMVGLGFVLPALLVLLLVH